MGGSTLVSLGALCNLTSFDPQQIKFCTMHALNLGFVLWAAGSCIDQLLTFGRWGGDDVSYDTKLDRAWHEFAIWAKDMKILLLA